MATFIMIFFQMLTLILGIYILANRKLGKKLFVILLLLGMGIGFPLYLLVGTMSIFLIIFLFMICLVIQTKEIFNNLIPLFVSIIVLVLSGYVAFLTSVFLLSEPLDTLLISDFFVISTSIISSAISIFLYMLIRYIFNKGKMQSLVNTRYNSLLSIFAFITIIVFYVNIFLEGQRGISVETSMINSLLFAFYVVLLAGVFLILFRVESRNIQMENERIQNKQLSDYIKAIESQNEEIRKFRHDYVNMLLTMTEYLNQQDIKGLTNYFSKNIVPIGEKFQSNSYQLGVLSSLKIPELKGIVSNKLIQAQDFDIQTSVEIEKPIEDLPMDIMNLCRSLGIILDNAIEEAKLCENPQIAMAFLTFDDSYLMVIKNSCCEDTLSIEQLFQYGFSTKGENRGRGLSILREILMSYEHIYLSTYVENGYFVQEIEIEKMVK